MEIKHSMRSRYHSRVMGEQVIGEAVELVGLLRREETIVNLINGLLQLWIALVVFARVVPTPVVRD